MRELNDITCYSNLSEISESNNKSISFVGKIFVDEEGWFEGIVKNPFNIESEEEFVFGLCHDDISIELIKTGDCKKIDPILYVCHKDDRLQFLRGEFMSLGSFDYDTHGDTKIVFDRANYYDNKSARNIFEESNELENQINNYKRSNRINDLYDAVLNNKINLSYYLYNKNNKEESVILNYAGNEVLKKRKLSLSRKTMFEDDLR